MEYSCLKTLAGKHKTTISQTVANNSDGKGRWGIEYITKDGLKRCYFANYTECGSKNDANDKLTNALVIYTQSVNSLEGRLKAKVCELCGTTESDHYELHHVNKLKNLKGKQPWEKAMLAKRRKTLVVCRQCHHDIHNGRV